MAKEKEDKYTPPPLSSKDQKILWGRAAGRCSMCKIEVTFETTDDVATRGEMCHIVGEKKTSGSPRGLSDLPLEDRNKYSNIILLCRNHHKEIDADIKKYSVPLLHKIKDDHEQWVTDTLSPVQQEPADVILVGIIDFLALNLELQYWNWFSENAARQLVSKQFIDNYSDIAAKKLSTKWPNKHKKLENAAMKLIDSYIEFVDHYTSGAELTNPDSEVFRPRRDYKMINEIYERHFMAEEHNIWAVKSFILFNEFTLRLNQFSEEVRNTYNPYFFITQGDFLVIDSLGTHSGAESTIYNPKEGVRERGLEKIAEMEASLAQERKEVAEKISKNKT